ncbi:MAG TPA: SAF domain-containing protein [Acidimicrobiia bacterium]|nr:SAF domain-containing protein [Acidimicrobiia bacterium]
MIWLQTPPWGRWAVATLIAAVSLWIEFRPEEMTPHPFALDDIPAGTTIDDSNTETRMVPIGTFTRVDLGQVARITIPAGDPVLFSQLGNAGTAAPKGWWSLEMPLPLGSRPGDAALIVLLDSDQIAEAVVIEDPGDDPLGAGTGLVAVEAGKAPDVARAAGEGRAVVMIAPP